VTDVLLMGTNAVTHWMDGGIPRHVSLDFSQAGSIVSFEVPSSNVAAPQGWYILFAMVDDIPSVGRIVHLTHSVPEEVRGLQLSGRDPTALTWSSTRSGGTPVTYEVATGYLSDVRGSAGFGAGSCLVSGLGDTLHTDTRPAPPPGDGFYYMVRARNDCFRGTYATPLRDGHGVLGGAPCP
jgi:hypothetical protein